MEIKYWKSRAKAGKAAWCVKFQKKQKFFKTKAAALKFTNKVDVHYTSASLDGAFEWNVIELVQKYLEHIEAQRSNNLMSVTTYTDRKRHANYLLQLMCEDKPVSHIKVNDLTRGHFVLQLIPQLASGRSQKTVANIMGSLAQIFNFGVIAGCTRVNEAAKISLTGIVEPKKDVVLKSIDPQIIAKILNAMDEKWRLIAFFATATGLRQGEQRALTWGDIDFDANKVRVSKAVKHNTRSVGAPKTSKGRRAVDIVPELKRQLQALYLQLGRPDPTSLVFTNNGKLMAPTNFRRTIIRACEEAEVNQIRWHDLRHFFASRLLQKFPHDLWRVSNLLGHEKTEITQRIYGHWLDDQSDTTSLDTMADAFAFAD